MDCPQEPIRRSPDRPPVDRPLQLTAWLFDAPALAGAIAAKAREVYVTVKILETACQRPLEPHERWLLPDTLWDADEETLRANYMHWLCCYDSFKGWLNELDSSVREALR